MEFVTHDHLDAERVFSEDENLRNEWSELTAALTAISEEDIIADFESNAGTAKSISQTIHRLVKRQLVVRGWHPETYIFADETYGMSAKGIWRLDFAKNHLCAEIAFDNRNDIARNLLKPSLACTPNRVPKAMQTDGGVVITATRELMHAGGLNPAVGSYDEYVRYLLPLSHILATPLIIVGLLAPQSFRIKHKTVDNKKVAYVERVNPLLGH